MQGLSLSLFGDSELITLVIGLALIFLILKVLARFRPVKDHFYIILLVTCYAFLIFHDLGTTSLATSTFDAVEDGQEIILETSGSFDKIYAISGIGDNNANEGRYQIYYRNIVVLGSDDIDGTYEYIATLDEEEFYKYLIIDVGSTDYRYIKLIFPNKNGVLSELWLVDGDTPIGLEVISDSATDDLTNAHKIIDEQDTFVLDPSYMDETYFDEIYHARNAYEIATGQKIYTAVHPLLGTEIIALGTKIFGFSTFGFRFMGALFTVLLGPLVYLLAREFLSKKWATLAMAIFYLDFMPFTTGRIATLEPFSVFFIVLMTIPMIRALKHDYTKDFKRHVFYLALSGLAMGLAISTKWTGVYAAMGLATIFFVGEIRCLVRALKEGRPVGKKTLGLFLFCVLFFIVIPLCIYVASFLPVRMYAEQATDFSTFIEQVINYNTYMFEYHTGLTADHPYASRWYMWLFDIRPIWYYVKRGADYIQTIACFNDPIVTISGLIGMVYLVIRRSGVKLLSDYKYLIIMYLAVLLPWIAVSRTSFSYHYYPCLPFLVILLVIFLRDLYMTTEEGQRHKVKRGIIIFMVVMVLIFVLFLPVISGFKTLYPYVRYIVRWLPTWYFG